MKNVTEIKSKPRKKKKSDHDNIFVIYKPLKWISSHIYFFVWEPWGDNALNNFTVIKRHSQDGTLTGLLGLVYMRCTWGQQSHHEINKAILICEAGCSCQAQETLQLEQWSLFLTPPPDKRYHCNTIEKKNTYIDQIYS